MFLGGFVSLFVSYFHHCQRRRPGTTPVEIQEPHKFRQLADCCRVLTLTRCTACRARFQMQLPRAAMQPCQQAIVQECRHGGGKGMQTCRHAGLQAGRQAGLQAGTMQECMHAYMLAGPGSALLARVSASTSKAAATALFWSGGAVATCDGVAMANLSAIQFSGTCEDAAAANFSGQCFHGRIQMHSDRQLLST